MKTEDFNKAIQIITGANSPKVSFNVPVTDNYHSVHQILIHRGNAHLIEALITAGFSLSMTDKGLSVDKY